jgi:enamine deaminase RidA (YjgF/YER057c/UK114 family)
MMSASTILFIGTEGSSPLQGSGMDALPGEVQRLAAQLESAGRTLESCIALDAFYDPEQLDPGNVVDGLSQALPNGSRPCLTVVPIQPGSTTGARAVTVQAVSVPSPISRGDGGRFPDSAASAEIVAVAGQVSADAEDIVGQSHAVMERLRTLLQRHDLDLPDAVKFNIYYVGTGTVEDWAVAARVRAGYFPEPGPVATGIPVLRFGDSRILIMMHLLAMRRDAPRRHAWPEGHWDWPFHLPYKHGLECEDTIFVGGQVSLTPRAEVIDPDDLVAQTRRSVANIRRVLDEFGGGKHALLRLTAFFAHRTATDPETIARVVREEIRDPGVEVSLVGQPYLAYDHMLVEIEAEAQA